MWTRGAPEELVHLHLDRCGHKWLVPALSVDHAGGSEGVGVGYGVGTGIGVSPGHSYGGRGDGVGLGLGAGAGGP